MHFTIKRGIVLTTLFTVVTPLLVLNWAKPGIAQEQQQSQQNNIVVVSNQQLELISKARSITDIAFQYAAAQRSASALKVLDQALALTEKIEVDCYKATPLMQVANGYILAGEEAKGQKLLTRAFQIAREQTLALCTSGTLPQESLLSRAKGYAAEGYDNFVLSIIDGVDNFTRPMQMAEIAGIYWQNKQPEKAREIIRRAIEIAQSQRLPEFITRRHMLMSIGFPLSEGGYPELLPPVIKQIQESFNSQDKASLENDLSIRVIQTLSLSKMLVATGEKAQAIALLNQVLPEIQALPAANSTSKILNLTQFATQYTAAGQPEQAKTLLMNAQTAAESLPSMDRDRASAMIARAYTEIGQVKMAEDWARRITSVDEREQVLGAIALEYAKTGNLSQAITIARSLTTVNELALGTTTNEMERTTKKEGTLNNIVAYLLKTKRYDQALELAKQEKIYNTPQMAMALADAGKPAQALQIAESLTAEEISRQSMCKNCVISAIAQSFAKQGQLEQALQLAQQIQSSRDLMMIAAQYIKIDRIANQNKATEILDQAWKLALSNS
ncbi:MAG: hypothetical protein WBG73_17425 [Coleofasciculaceae cyanobacterium]